MSAERQNDGAGEAHSLLFQLISEVGILAQLSHNKASRRLGPDLNMSQFIVLNHFSRLEHEASLSSLARALEVTNGAITNTISRLEAKGYIAIRPDPDDGRGKLARLTQEGREAHMRAVMLLSEDLSPLVATLSGAEMTAALLSLRKVRAWFDQNR